MRLFNARNDTWGMKWAWVDENNIVLGFDSHQCCCEDYGYYYHTDLQKPVETEIELTDKGLEIYRFDPAFHACGILDGLDCGNSFTVRLIDSTGSAEHPEVYLTIYNSRNGYYSHGFVFDKGSTTIYDGYL